MPKPNYKRAVKELMKILDEVEESKNGKEKDEIVDVTKESVGTVYQFTDNGLTIYKKQNNGSKKRCVDLTVYIFNIELFVLGICKFMQPIIDAI